MNTCKILFILTLALVGLRCERQQTIPPAPANVENKKMAAAIYPHTSDWGSNHGAQFLNNSAVCTTCHGAKLDGGSTGISCNLCHTSYPHTIAWARPQNHGATFSKMLDEIRAPFAAGSDAGNSAVLQNECVTCHKAPEAGQTVSPKSAKNILCNSCHVGVPHNQMMVTRSGEEVHHSEFGRDRALQANCLSCHREQPDHVNRKYMPNEHNCTFMCHAENPKALPRSKWMTEEEASKVGDYLDNLRKAPAEPKP
jgi:hypothetical protein